MQLYFAEFLEALGRYYKRLANFIHRKSLIDEWRSSRESDLRCVRENIMNIREEISLLEEYLEQNTYNLEALSSFSDDYRGYSSQEKLDKIISIHNSRYGFIMNDNPRFRNTVPPEVLNEYWEAIQILNELAEKASCKHS